MGSGIARNPIHKHTPSLHSLSHPEYLPTIQGLSTGAARGLLVEPEGRLSDAMTVETFKLALDDLVSNWL